MKSNKDKIMKKVLFTALLAVSCMAASAQEVTYEFQPHWYLSGQFGAQYTLGELKFGDLISPNAQVALGYDFTSVVGARLGFNAWQSKAGSQNINGNDYSWKWNYYAPALDLTVNLSNWIGGFKPTRTVNFSLFAGLGANIATCNNQAIDANKAMVASYGAGAQDPFLRNLWDGTKAYFMGHAGAMVDFRICDRVSLGIELQAATLSDKYNSKKAGNTDWYFNALGGIKINLGKTYATKAIVAAPIVAAAAAPVEKIVEKIVEKPVEKLVIEPLRMEVFFLIRSSEISQSEMQKVRQIAEYMKKYPEAKVSVTGYADKGTGNPTINLKYSEKRAQAVADALKNNYGIAESRITVSAKGDTEQPFEEQILNRVSICIAEVK